MFLPCFIGLVLLVQYGLPTPHRTCERTRLTLRNGDIKEEGLVPHFPVPAESLQVCRFPPGNGTLMPETCCTVALEKLLLERARTELAHRIRNINSHLMGLLDGKASQLKGSFLRMLHRMEKTMRSKLEDTMVQIAFKKETLAALDSFFVKLRLYAGVEVEAASVDDIIADARSLRRKVREAVVELFSDLFPAVFCCVATYTNEHICAADQLLLPPDYVSCLRENARGFHMFDPELGALARDLANNIVDFRAAFSSLALLEEFVRRKTTELTWSSSCLQTFTRLRFCTVCHPNFDNFSPDSGVCNGFCLNVLNGCLSSVLGASELKLWDRLVSGLSRFADDVDVSASSPKRRVARSKRTWDHVLTSFDSQVVNAIVVAVYRGRNAAVAHQVVEHCGSIPEHSSSEPAPLWYDRLYRNSRSNRSESSTEAAIKAEDWWEDVRGVARSLDADYRGWWSAVPELLCRGSDVSNLNCWDGQSLHRYTKGVVGVGEVENPEVQRGAGKAAAAPDGVDLESKMRNLQKVLEAGYEKGGEEEGPGRKEAAMLIRSTDPRTQYPDLQSPMEPQRFPEAADSGSGAVIDSDDEDLVTWYPEGEEGSGSGDGDWDQPREPHPSAEREDGIRPLWPQSPTPRDGTGDYKTSEKHPDDEKKPRTGGGGSRDKDWSSSQVAVGPLALLVLLLAALVARTPL